MDLEVKLVLRRRLNPWLALATVVAVGACGLNPQPDLPNNDQGTSSGNPGASPSGGTGGTHSDPSPGLSEGGDGARPGDHPPEGVEGGAAGGDQAGVGGESGSAGDDSGGTAGQAGAGGAR